MRRYADRAWASWILAWTCFAVGLPALLVADRPAIVNRVGLSGSTMAALLLALGVLGIASGIAALLTGIRGNLMARIAAVLGILMAAFSVYLGLMIPR